jgi:hypothetical protein
MMDKGVLENNVLKIEYHTSALRITSLTPNGKPNLLAELKDAPAFTTPYGDFHLRGGHRLWHAPEAMPRSYLPDDGQMRITNLPDGVILENNTEPGTGIRKQMKIQLSNDKPSAQITHTLFNDGLWPVELAAWAITMLRLGGAVILPMPVGNSDPAGLLPNRQISLWPYARINDPRLKLGDDFIIFKAEAMLPPFKIGAYNPHGWIAYWIDGILFRKSFEVHPDLPYPDYNCNAEIYCNDQIVELESLGPLRPLLPGLSVSHVETWEVFDGLDAVPAEVQLAINLLR